MQDSPIDKSESEASDCRTTRRRISFTVMSDNEQVRRGMEQCVTASQLVRHFGLWQERAARSPVYILHRGRPRFALTAIEVIEALCTPPAASVDDGALAALLDADDKIAMILDHDGRVRLASAAARARFGAAIGAGSRPAALALADGALLDDTIQRVIDTGITESLEIVTGAFPSRRLHCRLSAFPNGCLLHVTDMTTDEELASARAQLLATAMANAAAGAIGVRLSLRGYVITPSAALVELTGIAAEALAGARFVSLLTVASRVEAGEAIDAVASGNGTRRMVAECLAHGAAPTPVTIGLAPVSVGGRIEELAATVIRGSI